MLVFESIRWVFFRCGCWLKVVIFDVLLGVVFDDGVFRSFFGSVCIGLYRE